jgi:hypothetical protein
MAVLTTYVQSNADLSSVTLFLLLPNHKHSNRKTLGRIDKNIEDREFEIQRSWGQKMKHPLTGLNIAIVVAHGFELLSQKRDAK